MDIHFWGVRGSLPTAIQPMSYYGSNTCCIQLNIDNELFIFDAGTGLFPLGKKLPRSGRANIFISHHHQDHVLGLNYFEPFFQKNWEVNLYLPEWMTDLPHKLFDGNNFPILFSDLPAKTKVVSVNPEMEVKIRTTDSYVRVKSFLTNHRDKCLAYKLFTDSGNLLIASDHEVGKGDANKELTLSMLDEVDTAIVDANYYRYDYIEGGGHSYWKDWYPLAREAGVRKLVLVHHDPIRSDAALDDLQANVEVQNQKNPEIQVIVAYEGLNFNINAPTNVIAYKSTWMDDFIKSLALYKEESTLLDRILFKARTICQAEAGSFYLVDGDELVFAYSHNDAFFSENKNYKSAYVSKRMPINQHSICGYVADTQEFLNIFNVHDIPDSFPYSFDKSFDLKTNYHTESMLTIPIASREGKLLGVLQLINSKDNWGKSRPFSPEMLEKVRVLAHEAATFLEISNEMRENIYLFLRIAQMHDPSETGPHAERVGSIAAEVYQCYAEKNEIDVEESRYYKSLIRMAAMLHDIGKVGISDTILKKPGRFDEEERAIMDTHSELGAKLFEDDSHEMARMARTIALHHHQKWDGTGYPDTGEGTLKGEEIPLEARLVAIADVFDALVSKRCYKDAFSFDEALKILQEDSGSHFDPSLIECFMEILDTIQMIYQRFSEDGTLLT